jgi:hypothetical protein
MVEKVWRRSYQCPSKLIIATSKNLFDEKLITGRSEVALPGFALPSLGMLLKAEPAENVGAGELDNDKASLAQTEVDVKPWFVYPLLAGAVSVLTTSPPTLHASSRTFHSSGSSETLGDCTPVLSRYCISKLLRIVRQIQVWPCKQSLIILPSLIRSR